MSSLSFGFIIYICHGDTVQLVSLAIRQLADLARLPKPATVQTKTLAPIQSDMRQLYYNRLTSHQNKNIVITTITILVFFQATSILRTADKESLTMYHGLGFGFLLIIGTYLLGLIPFEQVLESSDNKEFTTYYKFGRLKFKRKKWDKADKVFLEQDVKRFYCLKIATVNGQTLQLEKYPTLDKADERLMEFKRLFD